MERTELSGCGERRRGGEIRCLAITLALLLSFPISGPAKNWTEEDRALVIQAAKNFYVPQWLAWAVYRFEDGEPGYEGGQAARAVFPAKYVQGVKNQQVWTMCQTIRRGMRSYMVLPYVRENWAKTDKDESEFLWAYRTDFLRHLAGEWKPRAKEMTAEESEAIWVRGVRSIWAQEGP